MNAHRIFVLSSALTFTAITLFFCLNALLSDWVPNLYLRALGAGFCGLLLMCAVYGVGNRIGGR